MKKKLSTLPGGCEDNDSPLAQGLRDTNYSHLPAQYIITYLTEWPLPAILKEGSLIAVLMCHFLEQYRQCGVIFLGLTYFMLCPQESQKGTAETSIKTIQMKFTKHWASSNLNVFAIQNETITCWTTAKWKMWIKNNYEGIFLSQATFFVTHTSTKWENQDIQKHKPYCTPFLNEAPRDSEWVTAEGARRVLCVQPAPDAFATMARDKAEGMNKLVDGAC